jgi:hypothetical protein
MIKRMNTERVGPARGRDIPPDLRHRFLLALVPVFTVMADEGRVL